MPRNVVSELGDGDDMTPTGNHGKRARVEEVEDDETSNQTSIYGSTDRVWTLKYPDPAGTPLSDVPVSTAFECLREKQQAEKSEPWAPFQTEKEWELAHWLMGSGVSQKKIDEFCKLKVIQEDVKPSYHNARSLLKFIDNIERGPEFQCTPIKLEGDIVDSNGHAQTETLELWHRDPVEVIKDLMGNPVFRGHQQYAPVQHFRNKERTDREYSEMWTGDWWWDVQKKLPNESGTVAPVIIASDQTQLSAFSGDKKAWPVYISVGNIEKAVRRKQSSRAFLLLGYIPTSKFECFSEKKRSQIGYQVFHDCMKKILEPLEKAGKEGIRMVCADGYERLVYPLLAAYIADYPEQCLVCCCKENSCPRCTVDPKKRGELIQSSLRTPDDTLQILKAMSQGLKPDEFRNQNLRPINPFWRDLPHCNIFDCMTPDLLHQLHKGLFGDHVSKWAQSTIQNSSREIDGRFRTMTPHPTLRKFPKGVSTITQWTGTEYKAMAKVFPGLLAGAADPQVLEVVRAFEDFMYYAHFEVHTDKSLAALDAAWLAFHAHKGIFQHLGVRQHFNISKLHNVSHYSQSIRSRGTTDGFNSESSERLHIDLAKSGYRASNKRHFQSQMTIWLTRQESMNRHANYIKWAVPDYHKNMEGFEDNEVDSTDVMEVGEDSDDLGDMSHDTNAHITYTYAKNPPCPKTTMHEIENEYNCGEWFTWYLRRFLEMHSLSTDLLEAPNNVRFPVWKKIQLHLPNIKEVATEGNSDTVYATREIPEVITAKGIKPSSPAQTSTVVVRAKDSDSNKGHLSDLKIARVHLIFKLPHELSASFPHLLAFVDWFTPLQKYFKPLGIYQLILSSKPAIYHQISAALFTPIGTGRMFLINTYLHEQVELARQADIERCRLRGLPVKKKKKSHK
ncbi:hypothetical protein K435DRAFT_805378 [Dendrothele bispora CBS 962.96]|uniref:Uncharacterized protein n=1 Tax=Dendrothele bispora (strain CBS 962.96) TaxID=1314807 RepID=A0A4S8LB85_DENBC|nr:hypothetical protein K435DRAFT_805378 [Dendrothele bispora CBS 962.96]